MMHTRWHTSNAYQSSAYVIHQRMVSRKLINPSPSDSWCSSNLCGDHAGRCRLCCQASDVGQRALVVDLLTLTRERGVVMAWGGGGTSWGRGWSGLLLFKRDQHVLPGLLVKWAITGQSWAETQLPWTVNIDLHRLSFAFVSTVCRSCIMLRRRLNR